MLILITFSREITSSSKFPFHQKTVVYLYILYILSQWEYESALRRACVLQSGRKPGRSHNSKRERSSSQLIGGLAAILAGDDWGCKIGPTQDRLTAWSKKRNKKQLPSLCLPRLRCEGADLGKVMCGNIMTPSRLSMLNGFALVVFLVSGYVP